MLYGCFGWRMLYNGILRLNGPWVEGMEKAGEKEWMLVLLFVFNPIHLRILCIHSVRIRWLYLPQVVTPARDIYKWYQSWYPSVECTEGNIISHSLPSSTSQSDSRRRTFDLMQIDKPPSWSCDVDSTFHICSVIVDGASERSAKEIRHDVCRYHQQSRLKRRNGTKKTRRTE